MVRHALGVKNEADRALSLLAGDDWGQVSAFPHLPTADSLWPRAAGHWARAEPDVASIWRRTSSSTWPQICVFNSR